VHPDLLIVRDNVETTCPTIWRLHSYQLAGTTTDGNLSIIKSAQNVTGQLVMLYPAGVKFEMIDHDDLNTGKDAGGKFGSSVLLKWNMR
jgi:hypothetical protein